ncbi:MAG: hypothetical protein IPF51_07665 [Dehalococcoidia bacterium]|uniref:hypothetical protein n=1 Tax=Candidatus Amarobacter glycogenicus TaxID=3140699 RepID=UPI0031358B3F|nr:hypothetical protein [Dehalococcoidia bacterium]
MLFTVRSGAFAAIAAVSALGFACGGGGSLEKVDAEDWVADVCDKAIDFDEASSDAIHPSRKPTKMMPANSRMPLTTS